MKEGSAKASDSSDSSMAGHRLPGVRAPGAKCKADRSRHSNGNLSTTTGWAAQADAPCFVNETGAVGVGQAERKERGGEEEHTSIVDSALVAGIGGSAARSTGGMDADEASVLVEGGL